MSPIKKHVGIIKNTGTRVVVIFRQVPDEPDNCLVVETDRLPEKYFDKMHEFIGNPVAKQTNNFYEFLQSRTFPDGTNALSALHTNKLLRKIGVDSIVMTPLPNQELPLRILNDQISGIDSSVSKAPDAELPPALQDSYEGKSDEEKEAHAKSLIAQVTILRDEANLKEKQAKELAPHLFKKKPGRPPQSAAEKAAKAKEAKAKRSARDKAKKESAKSNELDAKVMEKIERDLKRNTK